ncbi:MAG: hypothetical protein ACRC1J_11255 [Sandaracinobacteroides sp.]
MDRIRTGLTGLGAVFLITAATALLFGPGPGDKVSPEPAKAQGEPLSQLGVAPSNENAEPAAPAPSVEPAPPPATATPSAGGALDGGRGVEAGQVSGDAPVRI